MKYDYITSTVDGAEAFARMNSEFEDEDKPSLSDFVDYDENDRYEEDECNCSDPGCPCGGTKRGGL